MPIKLPRPILYLITRGETTEATTPQSSQFHDILRQVSAAAAARIDFVQLREKKLTARVLFELTKCAAEQTRGTATRLLVNDRADIAAGAGADGVHLMAQSLAARTIRRTFGKHFLIGASTHSLGEAMSASEEGADFIVFGPVFATASKEQYGEPVGLGKLSEVCDSVKNFPVLALGGVTLENAKACLDSGAMGLAGISLFNEPSQFQTIAAAIKKSAKGAR